MTHSAENDAPPRGRWLHAHLRACAVQVWFQSGGVGEPPACTCDTAEDLHELAQAVIRERHSAENDAPTYTAEDMATAWRDGWIVGNRWAFSDADADAIGTNPYVIPPEEGKPDE